MAVLVRLISQLRILHRTDSRCTHCSKSSGVAWKINFQNPKLLTTPVYLHLVVPIVQGGFPSWSCRKLTIKSVSRSMVLILGGHTQKSQVFREHSRLKTMMTSFTCWDSHNSSWRLLFIIRYIHQNLCSISWTKREKIWFAFRRFLAVEYFKASRLIEIGKCLSSMQLLPPLRKHLRSKMLSRRFSITMWPQSWKMGVIQTDCVRSLRTIIFQLQISPLTTFWIWFVKFKPCKTATMHMVTCGCQI